MSASMRMLLYRWVKLGVDATAEHNMAKAATSSKRRGNARLAVVGLALNDTAHR
jgi:hypothetical protein